MSSLIQLYRVYNTVIEMLEDRNYDKKTIEELYKNKTFDEFKALYKENLIDIQCNHQTQKKKIVVHFLHLTNKFKKEEFQFQLDDLKQQIIETNYEFTFHLLIISKQKLSVAMQKLFQDFKINSDEKFTDFIYVQYFNFSELLFNVTKHSLVPKHTVLSNDEKKQLLDNYSITPIQIAKIIITPTVKEKYVDPVAKYLGMLPGDVCKITRRSETGGESLSYRIAK